MSKSFLKMNRYPADGWIGGVCAGLAVHFDWNAKLLRLLFVLGLFIARGAPFTALVFAVMGVKLLIDFAYHLWAVRHYHRWLGLRPPPGIWGRAALATLVEPFSFQLARHTGAIWGWYVLITGRQDWAPRRHQGELS